MVSFRCKPKGKEEAMKALYGKIIAFVLVFTMMFATLSYACCGAGCGTMGKGDSQSAEQEKEK